MLRLRVNWTGVSGKTLTFYNKAIMNKINCASNTDITRGSRCSRSWKQFTVHHQNRFRQKHSQLWGEQMLLNDKEKETLLPDNSCSVTLAIAFKVMRVVWDMQINFATYFYNKVCEQIRGRNYIFKPQCENNLQYVMCDCKTLFHRELQASKRWLSVLFWPEI